MTTYCANKISTQQDEQSKPEVLIGMNGEAPVPYAQWATKYPCLAKRLNNNGCPGTAVPPNLVDTPPTIVDDPNTTIIT